MAEGEFYRGDGIVVLDATDDFTFGRASDVSHIVLTGTAAGSFVFVLGGVTITVTTGAADLTLTIPVGRAINYVKLTSGPTAAKMYVFLQKK